MKDAAPAIATSSVDRYTQISLYLLLVTGVLTLLSTGKVDLVSVLTAAAALLVKGARWWRGYGPELSHRRATQLVIAYFLFFPLDLWIFSRSLATGAPNPALYTALLILLLLFLGLAVSTFIGVEMHRSAEGAVSPLLDAGSPAARRLHRALAITSAAVAVCALTFGTGIFLLFPRLAAGYFSALNFQPSLISGFSDNVELGQIGEIKKNSAVVMRVKVEGGTLRSDRIRWRGVVLTTFDGKRWFNLRPSSETLSPEAMAGFSWAK